MTPDGKGHERHAARTPNLPAVDLYGPVHKGLRLALCELVVRVGRVDLSHAAELQQALDDIAGLLYLYEAHGEHEDRHLHRALEERRAGGSAERALEHLQHRQRIADLHALCLRVAEGDENSNPATWRALQLHLSLFVGEALVHMSLEELDTQPHFDALYSVAELEVLQRRLVGDIGPDEYVTFLRYMLRAQSLPERTALVERLQAVAPPSVLAAVADVIQAPV